MPSPFRAVVFDAYGTLFDVHSVLRAAGHGIEANLDTLSNLWRRKQIEYTWQLSLMGRYEDFRQVTDLALRAAVRQLSIQITEARLDRFMEGYLTPPEFPEVRSALQNLTGLPLAILSNGTAGMVTAAVENSGLTGFFAHIISADRVRIYKPSPRVYALGPETLGIPAADVLFVSSNAWDAAGAKSYGYQVCWCNRINAEPENLGFPPDLTVSSLGQITRT